MFSHTHTGVTDFERAFAFYSVVLKELGLVLDACPVMPEPAAAAA